MQIRKHTFPSLALFALILGLSFTSTAKSAVTVYFEQAGSDVKMSWQGTLNLSGVTDVVSTRATGGTISVAQNFYYYFDHNYGTAGNWNNTGLPSIPITRPIEAVGSWGFSVNNILWDTNILSGGTMSNPTQLTYDPTKQFYFLESTTLAAIGADAYDNTLAWTANNTGDSISYTTIPEPSLTLLLGIYLPVFLGIRRRISW